MCAASVCWCEWVCPSTGTSTHTNLGYGWYTNNVKSVFCLHVTLYSFCLMLLQSRAGNLVYVATGRHTSVPISVMLAVQVVVLLGLIFAWRRMATGSGHSLSGKVLSQPSSGELLKKADSEPVNATNPTFSVTPCTVNTVSST